MPRKTRSRKAKEETCDHCKTVFDSKADLNNHHKSCEGRLTCKWCNITFKNRGNLIVHEVKMHNDTSHQTDDSKVEVCQACDKTFRSYQTYQYHIRRKHFNLVSTTPLLLKKEVNDVWYERVHNSDIICEMKKTKPFAVLIKRYTGTEEVQIEENTEVEDLTHLYPTKKRNEKVHCEVCDKMIVKRIYKKHCDETHSDFIKHQCDNCKATFKRSYLFLRHVCPTKETEKETATTTESLEPTSV